MKTYEVDEVESRFCICKYDNFELVHKYYFDKTSQDIFKEQLEEICDVLNDLSRSNDTLRNKLQAKALHEGNLYRMGKELAECYDLIDELQAKLRDKE